MSTYAQLVAARSPIGYWRFQESSGTSIADSSGNSLTGTLSGSGYTQGVAGYPGDAADLAISGSADIAVEVADNALLDISGAITLEAWFKHSTSNFSGGLVWKSADLFSGVASNMVYEFGFLSGTLYFQCSSGGTTFSVSYDFTGRPANTWHLVTATWDGTSNPGAIKIFVDGVEVASGSTLIGGLRDGATPLKIAGKSGSANAYEHFPGVLSDVAVFGAVTSLATHQAGYTAGITPASVTLVADAGTLTLSGQAVGLKAGRKLTADAGSLALAGQPVTLRHGYTLVAESGNLSLAGQPAALIAARRLQADAGSLTLAGQAVGLTTGSGRFVLAMESGILALHGKDVGLIWHGRTLPPPAEVNLVPSAPSGAVSGKGEVNLT